MPRPSWQEIERAKVVNNWVEKDKQTNALATASHAALVGHRHYILQVDASYSSSSTSGLLQVKSGATVVTEKYIHGAGSFDFSPGGSDANATNEAVSAELAAGGAGVVGTITLMGFSAPE